MPAAVCLIAMLLAASPAAAQSSRVEAIAEQQAEKAKALGVEGASEAELIIRRLLLSPLLGGGDGIYPWFGSVYGGAGMGFGAGYFKRLEKAASINLLTGLSTNSSMMLRGSVVAPEVWRGLLQLDATAQWVDARKVSFYGFGQDSEKSARIRYEYSPFEVGGNATVKPIRHLFITAGYSYFNLDSDLEPGQPPDAGFPGLGLDLRYHAGRGTIAVDWRTSPGYSTGGGLLRASFARNAEASGEPYSFTTQEYEAVQLVPLVREQFVLAFRGLMTMAIPDDGHDVPVMFSPYLGSGRTLRGFKNRRFTDRNRILFTAEYRWRPSRYLDMALFVDSGQVARDRRDFRAADFDTAWGLGARFHGPTFTAFRMDVARGREGFRWAFSTSQPF